MIGKDTMIMDNNEIKNHEITDEEAAAVVGGFEVGDTVYYRETNAKVKIIGANRAPKPGNVVVPRHTFADGAQGACLQ